MQPSTCLNRISVTTVGERRLTEDGPCTSRHRFGGQEHPKRLDKDEEKNDQNGEHHAAEVCLPGPVSLLAPTADEETEKTTWNADILQGSLPVCWDSGFALDDCAESFLKGWQTKECIALHHAISAAYTWHRWA